MTISGTIEQAPTNAYYFTDVASNDIVFRGLGNNSFVFGSGSNMLSALRVNSNLVTISAPAIGIGTSLPQGLFHMVNSNASPVLILDGAGYGNRGTLRFATTNAGGYIQSGSMLSNDAKADIVFSSMMGTTEWMRIKSATGSLGIGSTNPQYNLDVAGTARVAGALTASTMGVSNIYAINSNINIGCDSNTQTINIGCTASNAQTINIGTSPAPTTINIGAAGDTVNITGNLEYVNTTNMTVSDKLVTLNKGGALYSAAGAGFEIEENGSITSYVKTSTDRNSFVFRSPNATTDLVMDMSAGGLNINNTFYLTSNNLVGIGTLAPQSQLHVAGGIYCSNFFVGQPTGTQATVPWSSSKVPFFGAALGSDNSVNISGYSNVNVSSFGGSGSVNIYTNLAAGGSNNAPKLTVAPSGNVGVGTTNPLQALHVVDTSPAYASINAGSNAGQVSGLRLGVEGVATSTISSTTYAGNLVDLNVGLNTTSNALYINTVGNVGINTSAPNQTFDVNGSVVIRNGNTPSVNTNTQLSFSYVGTDNYKHCIKTRHSSSNSSGNAIDFYVWQAAQGITSTGNKQVMSVTSTGVGMFTSNPLYALDVNGVINASNIFMNGFPIAAGSFWLQSMGGSWSPCNVAIGSSSNPMFALDVSGPIHCSGTASVPATVQGAYLNWNNDSGSGRTQIINSRGSGVGGFVFDMYTSNGFSNTAVIIDGAGNVGIGTSAPASKLALYAASSNLDVWIGNSNGNAQIGLASGVGQYSGFASSNDLVVKNNAALGSIHLQNGSGSAALTISPSNNVGLGTASPAYKLDINGSLNTTGNINSTGNVTLSNSAGLTMTTSNTWETTLQIGNNTSKQYQLLVGGSANNVAAAGVGGFAIYDMTSAAFRMNVVSSGRVGINITNPQYQLDVNGQTNATALSEGGVLLANKYALSNYTAYHWNSVSIGSWNYFVPTGLNMWYKIATFGAATDGGNASLLEIKGVLGGFVATTASVIDVSIGTRSGLTVMGALASPSAVSNITITADLAMYMESNNSYSLYLKCANFYKFDLMIKGYGYEVTALPPAVGAITSASYPSGSNVFPSIAPLLQRFSIGSNFGINNSNPQYPMDVLGQANATAYSEGGILLSTKYAASNALANYHTLAAFTTYSNWAATQYTSSGNLATGTITASNVTASNAAFSNLVVNTVTFVTATETTINTSNLAASNLIVSGNVGIGSTTPAYKLDVAGQVNGQFFSENGTLLTNKYLLSNTASNYLLTTSAYTLFATSNTLSNYTLVSAFTNYSNWSAAQYAPSNVLSNYPLTSIANSMYAPSNALNNYHTVSAFNTFSNWSVSQFAPSNTLSNYALTSTANASYAPSNTLSNYALTATATAQYAPSNTLSNYALTATANAQYAPSNTLSNYALTATATSQYAPSNTLSNYHLLSAFNTYSNWSAAQYAMSNAQSNYQLLSAFNTYSNWSAAQYAPSNTLSNYLPLAGGSMSGTATFCNYNVGVVVNSTNTFQTALQIGNSTTKQYQLLVGGSTSTTAYAGVGGFAIYDSTAGIYRLNVASSGLVGINSTNPQYQLDVNGQTNATLFSEGGTLLTAKYAMSNAQSNYLPISGGVVSGNLSVSTTIRGSNLLLGTGSVDGYPRLACMLNGNMSNNSYVNMTLGKALGNYNALEMSYNHVADGSTNNFAMIGFYGSANGMSFTSGGNVGIASTAPAYKLDVNGQANAGAVSEGGVLLTAKYAQSNTLSNYALTSTANAQYAPSNTLSNYALTATANTQYAPSNALANYHLTSAFNTYSNWSVSQFAPSNTLSNYALTSTANAQYAPSNTLSNYALTSTANAQYAPSNTLSNYALTSTANAQYAPSNTLSNYHLTSAFNTYSNWSVSQFAPSNTLSNYALTSTANAQYAPSNTLSNYALTVTATAQYAPSNTLSNYHLTSAFNTYSNWAVSQYAPSNTLSNYALTSTANAQYAPSNTLSNYHTVAAFNTFSNWSGSQYALSNAQSNYLPLSGGVVSGTITASNFTGSNAAFSNLTATTITFVTATETTISTSNVATSNLTVVGNAGIGTATPAYKLDVQGTGHFTGNVTYDSAIVTANSTQNTPQTGATGGTGDRVVLYSGSTGVYPLSIGTSPFTMWHSVPSTNQFQWYIGGSSVMTLSNSMLTTTGNVGIGSSSPAFKLDVSGTGRVANTLYADNVVSFSNNASVNTPQMATNGGGGDRLILWNGSSTAYPYSMGINSATMWYSVPTGTQHAWYVGGNSVMSLNGSALTAMTNVGIGTGPAYPLDVNGDVRFNQTITYNQLYPYGITTTNRRYAQIASILRNAGHLRIHGIMGGDLANGCQGRCQIDIEINARDGSINGRVSNEYATMTGIVVYYNSTAGIYTVYVTGGNYWKVNLILQGVLSNTTFYNPPTWSSDAAWTTPANCTLWFDSTVHMASSCVESTFYMNTANTPINIQTNTFGGNVGIGKTAPAYLLDVNGVVNSTGFKINGTSLATSATTDTTNASNITTGTLAVARLPTIPSTQLSGLATSATTDTTNATNITTGTLAVARLPTIPSTQLSGLATSATTDTTNATNITTGTLAVARLPTIPSTQLSGLATSATTDTTNATNIASGTLAVARLPTIPSTQLSGLATSATTDTTNATNITTGTLAVARGGTGATATTGSGSNVLSASPTLTGTVSTTGGAVMTGASGSVGRIYNITDGSAWNGVRTFKLGYFNANATGNIVLKGHLGYISDIEEFTMTILYATSLYSPTVVIHSNCHTAYSFWKNGRISFYGLNDANGYIHIYMVINNNYCAVTIDASATQYGGTFKFYQNNVLSAMSNNFVASNFKANDPDVAATYSTFTAFGTSNFIPYIFDAMTTGGFGIGTYNPAYMLDVNGQGNALVFSEAGTLLTTKYAQSNTLSNYALTASANIAYAPSNTLSNYHLSSAFNTYSNWAGSQYAPSNTLSNYVLTTVANTMYAPSNYTAYHWNSVAIGSYNYSVPAGSNMWYKIASLGATTDNGNASLIEIKGIIGGFISSSASLIDVSIGTRGGLTVLGSLSSPSALSNTTLTTDLAMYMESNNFYSVYVKCWGFYKFDISVKGYGQELTALPPTVGAVTSASYPSGSNVFTSIIPYLQRFSIGSNFGIGNSNPQYPMDIFGQANATMVSEGGTLLSTKYAPSNTLSNYHLSSAFNTYSNWSGSQYALSNAPFLPLAGGTLNGNFNVYGNGTFSGTVAQLQMNTANLGSPYLYMAGGNFNAVSAYISVQNGSTPVTTPYDYALQIQAVNTQPGIATGTPNAATSNWPVCINPQGGNVYLSAGSNAYGVYSLPTFYCQSNLVVTNTASASNITVAGNVSEGGTLLSAKYALSNAQSNYVLTTTANAQYAPSNTLSNYALTSTANSSYAPSNTLSNYALTSTANSSYAPSNTLSNYHLTSAFNTYSNWAVSQYAPSNALTNYVLTSTANTSYAPSNALANYVLTSTANTSYAPSNTLSNYHLTSAFNTYSNWAVSQYAPSNALSNFALTSTANTSYAPSNTLSNYHLTSAFNTYSNWAVSQYAPSNALSNYHLASAFNTYSNWAVSQYAPSNALSNYALINTLASSATTDTTNATNITSGTLAVARGGTGATATTGSGSNVLSASPTLTGTVSTTGGSVMTGASGSVARIYNITDGAVWNGVRTFKLGYFSANATGNIVLKGHLGYISDVEEFTMTILYGAALYSPTVVIHSNCHTAYSFWKNGRITFYGLNDANGFIHIYMVLNNFCQVPPRLSFLRRIRWISSQQSSCGPSSRLIGKMC